VKATASEQRLGPPLLVERGVAVSTIHLDEHLPPRTSRSRHTDPREGPMPNPPTFSQPARPPAPSETGGARQPAVYLDPFPRLLSRPSGSTSPDTPNPTQPSTPDKRRACPPSASAITPAAQHSAHFHAAHSTAIVDGKNRKAWRYGLAKQVLREAGGLCEARLEGCNTIAVHAHCHEHGEHTPEKTFIAVCRPCHAKIESMGGHPPRHPPPDAPRRSRERILARDVERISRYDFAMGFAG